MRHLDFAISTSSTDDDISELQERRAALAEAITETRRLDQTAAAAIRERRVAERLAERQGKHGNENAFMQ